MKLTPKEIPPAITQYVQSRMVEGRQLIIKHLQSLTKTSDLKDLPKRPLLAEIEKYLDQFLKNKSASSALAGCQRFKGNWQNNFTSVNSI